MLRRIVLPTFRTRPARKKSPYEIACRNTLFFVIQPSFGLQLGRSHYRRSPLTLLKLHQPLIETQGEHTHRLGVSPDMRNRRLEKLLKNLARIVTQGSFLETNRPVSECARSPRDPYEPRVLDQVIRLYFDQQQ